MKMETEKITKEAERETERESGGANKQRFFFAQIMILMDVSQSDERKRKRGKSTRASSRE